MVDAQIDRDKLSKCISQFGGVDDARALYCDLLNYSYVDLPIPIDDWGKSSAEIVVEGRIIARKNDFYIMYFTIQRLNKTNERAVLKELLKSFPDCVVVFSGAGGKEFHIVSPKYEPDSRHGFIVRRYVVGADEQLRTATERLCRTYAKDGYSTAKLKEKHDCAFDVDVVTKEFYAGYKSILEKMGDELQSQGIGDAKTITGFVSQFLNRLMFIYFIQKKGWLNDEKKFVRWLLREYTKRGETQNGIYADWFEPLFFYSFNNTKEIPDLYNLPSDMKEIYGRMPYLNGGLFRKNDLDKMGYRLNDAIIFNLIEKLLEIFNFTVSEDTPFDVEVAVNPEMLGKVYESLILEEERGKAGVFYTPRIEVDFMCRQSLVEHLVENTTIPYGRLINFVYSVEEDREDLLSAEEAQEVEDVLQEVHVVDPACGSGAFLVGMLQVLLELRTPMLKKLNAELNVFKIKKAIINNNLYGADIKDWAVGVAELRMWLTLTVDAEDSMIKPDSGIPRPLLPNLTLKLRCGDSLVQEIGNKPLSARAAITQLDPTHEEAIKELSEAKKSYYYHRSDDSDILTEIKEKEVQVLKNIIGTELRRINSGLRPLAATQQQLGSVQLAIVDNSGKNTKKHEKLEKEKEELEELLRTLDSGDIGDRFFWEIDFAEIFALGGFDIVIANPPYVRQEKIAPQDMAKKDITPGIKKNYKESLVRSVATQWGKEFKKDLKSDLYVYFYYQGLSLLKPHGVFCFISSNSWLDVGYGAKLQEFLLKNMEIVTIYDNHAKRTFAEADVNTIITLLKRPGEGDDLTDHLTKFVAFKKPFTEVIKNDNITKIYNSTNDKIKTDDFRCIPITQGELWEDGIEVEKTKQTKITSSRFIGKYVGNKWGGKYLRAPDIFFTILEKGNGKLTRLGDIAEVRFGIKTGANEFFYLPNKHFDIREEGDYYQLIPKHDELPADIKIEKVFLKPVIKSSKESKTPYIDRNKLNRLLFLCDIGEDELHEKETFKYVEWGKSRGFNQVPSCKSRKYWWNLGKRRIADILVPPGFGDIFRVFDNHFSKVYADKRLYEIYYNKADLLHCYLNCTLFPMFADAGSRTGLGDGLLDLTVAEFEDILIVAPDIFGETTVTNKLLKRNIGSVFTEAGINLSEPIREQEPHPLPDRKALDDVVFDAIALTEGERKEVYWSVCEMVKQRLAKAKSV